MLSNIFAKLLNIAIDANNKANLNTNSNINEENFDIQSIEGESFAINIDELPQDILIIVKNGRFIGDVDSSVVPDVSISGNMKSFLSMINGYDGIETDDIFINGKIGTAKRFQKILSKLTINWELFFAQFLPADLAKKGSDAVEQSVFFAKESAHKIMNSLRNYIVDEKKIIVGREEFEEFKKDIQIVNNKLKLILDKLQS